MKRTQKRGFTIVELVIVIAVIAILAAILIPTFSGIIEKANQSSDIQLIKNLNTALTLELQETGASKYETAFDAVVTCAQNGYLVSTIVAKSSLDIAWSRETGMFMLINTDNGEVIFPQGDDNETRNATGNEVNYFIFRSSVPTEGNDAKYSIFAGDGFDETEVELNGVGFDSGYYQNVATVDYKNETGKKEDVLIRTNTFETIINITAKADGEDCDTITHYGFSAIVYANEVGLHSYHEKGIVGRLTLNSGKVVIENGGMIVCPMDMDAEETGAVFEIASNGKIFTEGSQAAMAEAGKEGGYANNANGVAAENVPDCGAGYHTFGEKIVVDNVHMYEVCKCCGYTLITIRDASDKVTKQTKNAVVDSKVEEIVTPIRTYATSETIPETIPEGKSFSLGNVLIDTPELSGETDDKGNLITPPSATCDHDFKYTDHGHDYGDNYEKHYCLGTCQKCGITIRRAHDYWYTSQIPGVYEYTGTCTLCRCGRETHVARVEGFSEGFDSFADALKAVHESTTTKTATIRLIQDDQIDVKTSAITIASNENITIDLNGQSLVGYASDGNWSELILNNGTLTISDSTDTNKDGTGKGIISFAASKADLVAVPTYASNIISNHGTLNVESGYLYNSSSNGSAAFTIDCYGGSTTNITGGFIDSKAGSSLRMFLSSTNMTVNIKDAIIHTVWVQDPDSNSNFYGSLTIDNSTIDQISVGYNNKAEHVYCKVTNSTILDGFLYELPYEGTNNYLYLENNKITGFYMPEDGKVLGSNSFYIAPGTEIALGWKYVNESDAYKKRYGDAAYSAQGIRIDYNDNYPGTKYYAGYLNEIGLKLGIQAHAIDGFVFKEDGNNSYSIGEAKYQIIATYADRGTYGTYSSESLAQTTKTSLEAAYPTLTGEILSSQYVVFYWYTSDTSKVYIDDYFNTEAEALAEKADFDSKYDNSTYNIKSSVESGRYVLKYEATFSEVYGNYLTYEDAQAALPDCEASYEDDFVSAKIVEIE